MKGDVTELETNNKNKEITESQVVSIFMNGYQHKSTIINAKNSDTVADS